MKSMFKKLNRTAWVAFTLMSVLMILYLMMYGQWPTLMIVLWCISLALFVMVLVGCIVLNIQKHHQAGTLSKLLLRYVIVAAAAFVVLVLLDLTVGKVAWQADAAAGLVLGLLGLYARP